MADNALLAALSGMSISPSETLYGQGSDIVGRLAPGLISPRNSFGRNLGTSIGASLIAGLLGYQARQQAAADTLQAAELSTQMLGANTPEERLGLLKSTESPLVQSRLGQLSAALNTQQLLNKLNQQQKVGELETAANFELSSLGQQLQAQKLKQAILLNAVQGGNIPTEYAGLFTQPENETMPTIPGFTPKESREIYKKQKEIEIAQSATPAAQERKNAVGIVNDLEQTFKNLNLNAAEFNRDKLIPGTPAELAWSKLNGSLAALARVSGQTSQLSDTDLRQQRDSIQGPTVLGVPLSGTESIAKRLKAKLEAGKQIINEPELEARPQTDKLAILAELRAEIAAEKARRVK